MPMTPYLMDKVIAEFIGSTMHLYVTMPTDEDEGVEVSGGSYAPQPSSLDVLLSDQSKMTNIDYIEFAVPDVTVAGYGFKTAGGELIYYESLPAPPTYTDGALVTIQPETLTIDLN